MRTPPPARFSHRDRNYEPQAVENQASRAPIEPARSSRSDKSSQQRRRSPTLYANKTSISTRRGPSRSATACPRRRIGQFPERIRPLIAAPLRRPRPIECPPLRRVPIKPRFRCLMRRGFASVYSSKGTAAAVRARVSLFPLFTFPGSLTSPSRRPPTVSAYRRNRKVSSAIAQQLGGIQ
jgi:hypothetical protein